MEPRKFNADGTMTLIEEADSSYPCYFFFNSNAYWIDSFDDFVADVVIDDSWLPKS
ncbi:hypothetical protein AAFX24_28665 [Vibrio mediterranei]|uniref:hypothetical protein n=1 Tax=Vibrio mediterranei TaxID=689 RepID=UPI0038CF0462